MTKKNELVKPFLKWAGGKRQLLEQILPLIHTKGTYYEPFIGGGAVLFALQPKKAVINDLNEQLCLTYTAVRDHPDELIKLLKKHAEQNKKDGSEYYYRIRDKDRKKEFAALSDTEKAARLIYLNKTCYNGLYRVNSAGLFNTPYGYYKNPGICEEEVLRAVSRYFNENEVTILNEDFEKSVESAKKGDFVYFDPPYDSPNCTNFTGYQAGGFDHEDQTRLRDLMVDLKEKGVKCLLSNSKTDFIEELYEDRSIFTVQEVSASRMINSDALGRGKVPEVLVRNWK
jgi:DNA adenine methylase